MNWTVWDILVVAGSALQLACLVGVLVVVVRIVRGPIAGVAGRGVRVVEKVSGVAGSTLSALNTNRAQVESIVTDVQGIAGSVRSPDRSAGLPINYGTLRNGLATLAMVRRGARSLRSLGKLGAAPPGPSRSANARPLRPSLPERLGLLPPALKPILRLLPYARIALNVLRQVKGRGV
ncbi:MAG: hypothetical protein H7Z41_08325 [Cytophagales bacterium]|nr:hypothetical protein [Armatimonadota bacterium]